MPSYQAWTLAEARGRCRQELMDYSARWWNDSEINSWINEWQSQLQQEYEFTWTTSTYTTALNTITLSSLSPEISRLDAIYWIGPGSLGASRGYRLNGRLLQDVEVAQNEWRTASPESPRAVIQYDSTQLIIWPPLTGTSTFTFEAPAKVELTADTDLIRLPIWSQWSLKPYVCEKAYLRLGPNNDLTKARKYQALYQREKAQIKLLWDQFIPERWRRLKPGSPYDYDIISLVAAGQSGNPVVLDQYLTLTPSGSIDSSNRRFLLPSLPGQLRLFLNGELMEAGVDYTLSGVTLDLSSPPLAGDTLLAWVFVTGVTA